MREILFRGKRIGSNRWVYGSCVKVAGANGITPIIVTEAYLEDNMQVAFDDYYYVQPETLGQYTGLHDKNGERIFEGDIVRIKGSTDYPDYANVDYPALIAFLDGGFCAIDGTIEEHAFRRYALARFDFDLEVIGNIHDNPELLEE